MHMLHQCLRPLATHAALRRRVPLPARPNACAKLEVKSEDRYFSTSTPKNAEEDNTRVLEALAKSSNLPDISKITENPAIVQALTSLVQIAQEEGIDISTRPSMQTMIKMATNNRIREAILKVQQQFEAAGIKVTAQNALEVFNNLKGTGQ